MRSILSLGIVAWSLLHAGPLAVAADALTASENTDDQFPWATRDRLCGKWNGQRTRLEDHGLTLWANDTWEASQIVYGGVVRSASARNLADVGGALDTNKAFHWPGGTLSIDLTLYLGDFPSDDVGDWQGFTNIESRHQGLRLASITYEQWLDHDQWRFVIGRMTAVGYFDSLRASRDFLNTSAAYSPTILSLPVYPRPQPMADAYWYPHEDVRLAVGIAKLPDSQVTTDQASTSSSGRGRGRRSGTQTSTNLFLLTEASLSWNDESAWNGRAFLGGYLADEDLTRFDGSTQHGAVGAYAGIEQRIWQRSDDDQKHGLIVFAQGGVADPRVSDVAWHEAVGVVLRGVTSERRRDSAGAYVTRAVFSRATGAGFPADAETAYEAYYKAQILGWFALQPDLQYIVHPGAGTVPDATVVTLRGLMSF